jgi:hypothetical protein
VIKKTAPQAKLAGLLAQRHFGDDPAMSKIPTLFRVIGTDYGALVAFLIPIIAWGLYGLGVVLEMSVFTDLPLLALIFTVAAVLALWWRYRTISTIFSDGLEVPGVISGVSFFRDRGRVEYIYTYLGQKCRSGNAIHKTGRTTALKQGQDVTLVIDRNNPSRAFIRDLYL